MERQQILEKIESIDKQLSEIASNAAEGAIDKEFFAQADNLIIQKQLTGTKPIKWVEFTNLVETQNLQKFLRSIIVKIVYYKRQIISIEFKNGIVHKFIY